MKKLACKRGHVSPQRTKHGACVPCAKVYRIEHYQRDREYRIAVAIERAKQDPVARRDQQRAHRLGVSVRDVRAAIAAADGKCEACFIALTNAQMCIDHCHNTGRIRGILCRFCNALEGMLSKKKERVAMIKAYINREIKRLGGEP